MFRRLPVAGKLTLALLPLVLAVIGLGGIFSYQTYQSVEGDRVAARAANALLASDQALAAIDVELQLGLETTAGKVLDLTAARERVDDRMADLERSLVGVPTTHGEPLQEAAHHLEMARAELDGGSDDGASVFGHYAMVIDPLLNLADRLPSVAGDRELFFDLSALRRVIDARHHMALQQLLVLDVVSGRNQILENQQRQLLEIEAQTSEIERAAEAFLGVEAGRWDGRFDELAESGRMQETAAIVERLTAGGPEAVSDVGIIEWISRLDGRQDRIIQLAGEVGNDAIGQAQAGAAEAQQRVLVIAGGTAVVVLLTILLTSLTARSVARRIRQVAERARDVSEVQIPTLMEALENPKEEVVLPQPSPIRDSSKDELGELSRSFNTMQVTIDDVARRQIVALRKGVSEIFVSLARRNRGLIDRQLAVIDELERDETNPETLSDLYRLDHLATRMRRNAENLLVLAGTETPRRWSQPVDLDDCVRAAIGEVEEYRRVDVLNLEPIAVKGGAVTDISHLLAELIDNATTFSPPQTRVRVAGYFDTSGYLITVADSGVGLGPVKLDELNELLAQPPVIGLALEPTLGLYVVARLARRHGIDVRLVKGAPGVTAQVRIPASLYEASVRANGMGPGAVADGHESVEASPQLTLVPASPEPSYPIEVVEETESIRPVPRNGAIAARLRQRRTAPTPEPDGGVDPIAPPTPFRAAPAPVEPVRPAITEDEPARPEPVRSEPARSEPARPEPSQPEPLRMTEDGLPIRNRTSAPGRNDADEGVHRSERSAHGLRTAFSQFQQGAQIARRGTTEDDE